MSPSGVSFKDNLTIKEGVRHMNYYSGIDVSLKESFISIIDEGGKLVREAIVPTDEGKIAQYFADQNLNYKAIGVESGQLSISLCKALKKHDLPIICVDARHMASALSARINKNDKNDARGIAQMMRTSLYKEVEVKSDEACTTKVLLGSRRQLVNSRLQIRGTIRGLLKIYGIKLGDANKNKSFESKVEEALTSISEVSSTAIEALLKALESVEESLAKIDKEVLKLSASDKDCKLLMTAPGVGPITAMSYKSTIDRVDRFRSSEAVGAYLGLTPRQYASGEVNRQGSISKMGPIECRSILYEAANCLLWLCKKESKIKSWGLKLAKKKGRKKAIVAVARKLAVVMHRMLVTKKEFCHA